MRGFGQEDYLFLTHLDSYLESVISEREVDALICGFPGEVFLVNEFPRENEEIGKDVFGQEEVPGENRLQTKVGLGEPETLPEKPSGNVYFGGFNLTECLGRTVEKIFEEYGEEPNYAVLPGYTFCGGRRLEDMLEDSSEEHPIGILEDLGYVEPCRLSYYPGNCSIIKAEI